MLLLLAEVLSPINIMSKFLQTRNLNYLSLQGKFKKLLSSLENIKSSIPNHDAVDSKLKYFTKANLFLSIAVERAQLSRQTRSTIAVPSLDDIQKVIAEFIESTATPFIDEIINEIQAIMTENSPFLSAFDAFNPDSTSVEDREDQLKQLSVRYGNELSDVFQGHKSNAEPIVDQVACSAEMSEFFGEFDDATVILKEKNKKNAFEKVKQKEIHPNDVQEYIANHSPTAAEVYQYLCKEGCLIRYPNTMRLFRLALLIPPSTANVERGFSAMNLLCSPLRTSLNEESLDCFMRINLNGPAKLDEKTYDTFVTMFKNLRSRRIDL